MKPKLSQARVWVWETIATQSPKVVLGQLTLVLSSYFHLCSAELITWPQVILHKESASPPLILSVHAVKWVDISPHSQAFCPHIKQGQVDMNFSACTGTTVYRVKETWEQGQSFHCLHCPPFMGTMWVCVCVSQHFPVSQVVMSACSQNSQWMLSSYNTGFVARFC